MKNTHFTIAISMCILFATISCSKKDEIPTPIPAPKPIVEPQATAAGLNSAIQDNSGKTVLYWYDPMVAAKHFEKPGKSPFMDMQLIPKYADDFTKGGQP